MARLAAAAAVILCTALAPAMADVSERTKVSHYRIGGKTPLEVVREIDRKGIADGERVMIAWIATSMRYGLEFDGASCDSGNFDADLRFTINLPKPWPWVRMSQDTRKQFDIFYRFLKQHEEAHRSITMQCMARIERRAERLTSQVRSCARVPQVRRQLDRIAADELARCKRLHAALDRRDEKEISRFELYRNATAERRGPGARATPVLRSGLGLRVRAQRENQR